ncbi:MAG: hypothetical protein RLZZ540_2212 [Bacteroidota bacterium]|jgi:hypothetical protein
MVENRNKELSKSFTQTLASPNLTEIGSNIAEVTIDSVLKEGVLKDFPVIGSLVGIWKTGVAVNDYRFLNKLLLFLQESSSISEIKRENIISKLEDEQYQLEAGEKLIAVIDKLETGSKAKLLGKALALFGNDIISKDEFWRVSFVIERLPMSDIIALKNWRNIDLNRVFEIRRHLYLSVGLGWFVLNISSTGFCWQERLCEIFEKHLIEE